MNRFYLLRIEARLLELEKRLAELEAKAPKRRTKEQDDGHPRGD